MVATVAPRAPEAPDPRSLPLPTIVLHDRWLALVPLVLGLGRMVAVAGMRGYVYVDSAEYGVVDFTGRWRRPWATPLLYAVVGHDPAREVRIQALVGVLAWTVLAWAVAAWFRDATVRAVVVGTVVALGLTTSVTNWDAAILSESLALSLTVLVIAAWLELARRPRVATAAWVVAVTLPWSFVRQSLLPTAAMVVVAVVVAVVATWARGGRWRVLAGLAVALALLTGLAAVSYDRNQEVVRTNVEVIIGDRIAKEPAHLAWFVDHGMPEPASGSYDPGSLERDPAFVRWLATDGRSTYARFLFTHPWWTLTAPLPELTGERPSFGDPAETRVAMLSPADAYGRIRPVLPEPLEQLLFDPGATGTILSALGVVAIWSLVRRRRADRGWAVPLGTVAISLASLVAGWHGAVPELNRLAIVAAVALRVGLIVQIGLLVEAERDGRASATGRPGVSP